MCSPVVACESGDVGFVAGDDGVESSAAFVMAHDERSRGDGDLCETTVRAVELSFDI